MPTPWNRVGDIRWFESPSNRKEAWDKLGYRNGDRVSPMPYASHFASCTYRGGKGVIPYPDVANTGSWQGGSNTAHTLALNRAYSWFKSKVVDETSSLGVTLAEYRESLGMIRNRANQLRESYKAFRRGNLVKGVKSLGLVSDRQSRRARKKGIRGTPGDASRLWLEYWFGWKPLLGDIYNALEQLSEPIPYGDYVGTGRYFEHVVHVNNPNTLIFSNRNVRGRIGAEVACVNPNEYLRSQMGIVNPAAVAWELIPFSFLVDWVADVGSFLDSYSDFFGLDIRRPYFTTFVTYTDSSRSMYWPHTDWTVTVEGRFLHRQVGLYRPKPVFSIDGNLKQSVTRAATAVSLLLQMLKA